MLNILMAANIVLSFAAFVLAVLQVNHLAPWAIGIATVNAVTLFVVNLRRDRRRAPAQLQFNVHVNDEPARNEISAVMKRVRAFLNDRNGQPPNGAVVECEACHVTESYPVGNDAAQSAHLLTHPERCRVTV